MYVVCAVHRHTVISMFFFQHSMIYPKKFKSISYQIYNKIGIFDACMEYNDNTSYDVRVISIYNNVL